VQPKGDPEAEDGRRAKISRTPQLSSSVAGTPCSPDKRSPNHVADVLGSVSEDFSSPGGRYV
jgi:hypothetical protein